MAFPVPTTMAMPAALTTDNGPITVVVSAIMMGLATFCIGLRCYSSARVSKDFDYNDVLMIGAVLIGGVLFALLVFAVQNGVGKHTSQATVVGIGESLKFVFFLEIIYVILTSIMKASLALTLMQWSRSKVHTFLLQAAIVIDVLICVIVVEYFLLQCAPIAKSWKLTDPTFAGVCLPATQQIVIGEALSVTTITLDMLFLFTPFFMLRNRGVPTRVKLFIYGLFGLGVIASVANFIRLGQLVQLNKSTDLLFDAAPVFLWSAVEVSIGIMAAGLIELSPLMSRLHVRGFEAAFDQMEDDLVPIRLESMNKSNISFPANEREMVIEHQHPGMRRF